eukprot:TRINITY_DN17417_c0_g1_i1.p1 TRINITY_DN17417_c0_g1~~TRINITY_DN17417_c0_g1_i1.p1  ORF type:complete len:213 (-),score=35.66 TRINITY_DN17417_c0_g1_i1:75-713(-)
MGNQQDGGKKNPSINEKQPSKSDPIAHVVSPPPPKHKQKPNSFSSAKNSVPYTSYSKVLQEDEKTDAIITVNEAKVTSQEFSDDLEIQMINSIPTFQPLMHFSTWPFTGIGKTVQEKLNVSSIFHVCGGIQNFFRYSGNFVNREQKPILTRIKKMERQTAAVGIKISAHLGEVKQLEKNLSRINHLQLQIATTKTLVININKYLDALSELIG